MENENISELAKKYLNEEVLSLTELKKGRVYLVETLNQKIVLKITKLEWAVDEVFFFSEIQKINVSSPRLISYGALNDTQGFIILEYISDCQSVLDQDLRKDRSFWVQLAEGTKKINSIPVEGFGFNKSKVFGEQHFTSNTFGSFIKDILSELQADLSNTEYRDWVVVLQKESVYLPNHEQAYLAHGDLGGNNFLWDKKTEKLYFFDPSYFRGMPKTWDIAYFGWRTGEDRVTDEDVKKLSSFYFNDSPTKEEEFEISFMRALIGLVKIRDGVQSGKFNESHAIATRKHIQSLTKLGNTS